VTSIQGSGSTLPHPAAVGPYGEGEEEDEGGTTGWVVAHGEGTTGWVVAHGEGAAGGAAPSCVPVPLSMRQPSARVGATPWSGRGLVSSFVMARPSAMHLITHVVAPVGSL
jgi:hypothetical protein